MFYIYIYMLLPMELEVIWMKADKDHRYFHLFQPFLSTLLTSFGFRFGHGEAGHFHLRKVRKSPKTWREKSLPTAQRFAQDAQVAEGTCRAIGVLQGHILREYG